MQITSSLVSALFGGSGSLAPQADAATAVLNYRRAIKSGAEAKGLAQEAKDPVTIRAFDQFRKALAKATTLDQALSDPRVMNVLIPAVGLASQTAFPGLVKRVLLSDPKDPKGLASVLGTSFRDAAATLDLRAKGLAGLQNPATIATLEKGFLTYNYRSGLDEGTNGLSDALYFRETAGTVDNAYDILGNAVLRRVVTGALGLPPQIVVQSVESQARAVTSRLDIAKLQDPRQVEKLITRYLVNQAPSSFDTGGGLNLFQLAVRA